MLATHQRDGVNSLRGRQTHLVPVEFESGRPLFAPGTGRVAVEMTADGVPDQLPPIDTVRDDFDADALDLGWNAVRWLPSDFVDVAARPGFARLRATTDEPTIVGRTSFMGRRLGADTSRIAARFELDGSRSLRAGLLLRTTETGLLELAVHADGVVRGVLVDDGVRTEVGAVGIGVDGPVDLSISIDRHVATLVANSESVGMVDITCLATGRPGWFMGSWWGPFAVGVGHVDVDFVEVNQGVRA
jgi:alpha-N-arabinofuranosidase